MSHTSLWGTLQPWRDMNRVRTERGSTSTLTSSFELYVAMRMPVYDDKALYTHLGVVGEPEGRVEAVL